MSTADLRRFTGDVRSGVLSAEEARQVSNDAEALRRYARERGYELSHEEARGLSESAMELSDDDLEDVAGGWDGASGTGGGEEPSGGG